MNLEIKTLLNILEEKPFSIDWILAKSYKIRKDKEKIKELLDCVKSCESFYTTIELKFINKVITKYIKL